MKGYEKVKELVEGELDDYSFFSIKNIEMYDDYKEEEYYRVEIETNRDKKITLHLKYNIENDKISVELGEDTYEEVKSYDYTIKYFWMALLEW